MKNNIIAIFVTATVSLFCLTGCKGMLDEVNYGNPTVEDMMTSEDNVILLVGQAYAEIKWMHDHWGYWGVSSLTADECICPIRMPKEDWSDGNYWRKLNTHKWTDQAAAFEKIWNTTISGAVLCNKLIQTINNYKSSMSETVYKQYLGELEVMRSYYYYLLFDCFGRIPYLEEYSAESHDPLMEPQQVWSKLVACLERNAPNMAVVNDANRAQNYGRTTQGMAYALLARLYLNAESFGCTPQNITAPEGVKISSTADFYTNAVRCCDAVINSGSYKIEDNFFDNFRIHNENSKENIFVIVENGVAGFDERDDGSGKMMNKLRITLLTLNYGMQETYAMQIEPWNGFSAREKFVDRYNQRDVRGTGNEGKGTLNEKEWGWFVGPIYNRAGTAIVKDRDDATKDDIIVKKITSLTEATNQDGARCLKYEIDKKGEFKYCENDFVLLRYADVLWMKEEAILRGGQGTSGVNTDDFKRMKARAFAYDNGQASYDAAYPSVLTLDGILDERGREFAWECVRRRDLIRYGKYNDPSYIEWIETTPADTYRNWFPIPYNILEKSYVDESGKKIWTQNPGY